jgi:hypothetical protein
MVSAVSADPSSAHDPCVPEQLRGYVETHLVGFTASALMVIVLLQTKARCVFLHADSHTELEFPCLGPCREILQY